MFLIKLKYFNKTGKLENLFSTYLYLVRKQFKNITKNEQKEHIETLNIINFEINWFISFWNFINSFLMFS